MDNKYTQKLTIQVHVAIKSVHVQGTGHISVRNIIRGIDFSIILDVLKIGTAMQIKVERRKNIWKKR